MTDLTEAERREVGCNCWRLDGVWHHVPECRAPAVERILAARSQRPEGVTVTEWGHPDTLCVRGSRAEVSSLLAAGDIETGGNRG